MKASASFSHTHCVHYASHENSAPFPHWAHELGWMGARLEASEAEFISSLLMGLRRAGERYVLAFYPVSEDDARKVMGASPALVKSFRRRAFFMESVYTWMADVVEPLPDSVRLSWLNGGNDTVLWGLGNEQSIIATLKERFVDDAEANPVNELALLEDGAETAISRGWDGQTLRVYSRYWDADRFGQLITALVSKRAWSLQSEPTLLGA